MKTISIGYLQTKPHFFIRGDIILYDNIIPLVGDIIHVPPFCIFQVSKKLKNRESIKSYGIKCVVIGRELHIHSFYRGKCKYPNEQHEWPKNMGDNWRLTIKPIEELIDLN